MKNSGVQVLKKESIDGAPINFSFKNLEDLEGITIFNI